MPEKQIENTQKWMRALLSGRYRQGEGALKRIMRKDAELSAPSMPVQYCCLGVAAEEMGADIVPESENLYGTLLFRFPNFLASRTELPFGWAQYTFGDWLNCNTMAFLVGRNDNDKWSFPELAMFISKASGVPLPEIEIQDTPSC